MQFKKKIMKQIITLILFLTLTNSIFAQEFNFKMLEKLTTISFVSIDKYMTNIYGFEKINEEDEGRKRTYARFYKDNYDNTIIISVISPKDKPNVLDISVAKNYDIRSIKDEILSREYEYKGTNKYGFIVFKKDKSTFLIGQKPNESQATQIMLINEW